MLVLPGCPLLDGLSTRIEDFMARLTRLSLVTLTISVACSVVLLPGSSALAAGASIGGQLKPYNPDEIAKQMHDIFKSYRPPPDETPVTPKEPRGNNPCIVAFGGKSCEEFLRTQGYVKASDLSAKGGSMSSSEKCATKADLDQALKQLEGMPGLMKGSTGKSSKKYDVAGSGSAEKNVKDKKDALDTAKPGMDQVKKSTDLDSAIKADMDKQDAQTKQDKGKK